LQEKTIQVVWGKIKLYKFLGYNDATFPFNGDFQILITKHSATIRVIYYETVCLS